MPRARQPTKLAVGVELPSAYDSYADGLLYANGNALGIAIFHFTTLILEKS
jgi:hypothetical protein